MSVRTRHMEQPGSRQSIPASMRILSRPSRTACSLTRPEPGTTIAYTSLCTFVCSARLYTSTHTCARTHTMQKTICTFLPLTTAATARISSIRPLVQDPTNTCVCVCVCIPPHIRARTHTHTHERERESLYCEREEREREKERKTRRFADAHLKRNTTKERWMEMLSSLYEQEESLLPYIAVP